MPGSTVTAFGVMVFVTDETPSPAALAQRVEERGLESLFLPEHTHIPVRRATPRQSGGELPREYRRTLDPFVALAAAATATTRIKVGTGVSLLAQRDPILAAKEVATLDHVSAGRALYGVGAGWNVEEMANHGTPARRRFALLTERLEAIKAIWTLAEAEYHGRHVDFDPIWCWPKPVQDPHPPILVGGNGARAIDIALRCGDEWAPMLGPDETERGLLEMIPTVRRRAREDMGRPAFGVTLFGARPDPRHLERCCRAGVTRGVRRLGAGSDGEIEAALDEYVAAIAQLEGTA